MNRTVVWLCVLAAVAVAAAIAFFSFNRDDRSSVADPPRRTPATTSATAPGLPVLPSLATPSLPPGSEDAQRALEIQRIIFDVTQEALSRPKDDRMTAEEIQAEINSRIEELKARP